MCHSAHGSGHSCKSHTTLPMQSISGLDSFRNMRHLDLSNNAIHTISNISCLVALRKLVLSNNRIAAVQGLESLLSLEHLLLQGNCIQAMSSLNLDMLAALPCLATLYLQNPDGQQVRRSSYSLAAVQRWVIDPSDKCAAAHAEASCMHRYTMHRPATLFDTIHYTSDSVRAQLPQAFRKHVRCRRIQYAVNMATRAQCCASCPSSRT